MEKEDAFSLRIEILMKELDAIDSSIRKIDDIGNNIKNWSIVSWAGSIAAILTKPELHSYMLFTAIPPILFMFTDAHWRKIQRRFSYRQGKISDFINSKSLDEAYESRKLNFHVLDPIARKYKSKEDFIRFISITKILTFPTVSLIYIGLSILSIAMAAVL